jgi:hypothetical protein
MSCPMNVRIAGAILVGLACPAAFWGFYLLACGDPGLL